MANSEAFILHTTVAKKKDAKSLASQIVTKRLAACVQIVGPIESVYRWNSKLCRSREFLLQIKTLKTKRTKLLAFLQKEHPYEVPELVELSIDKLSHSYLQWMNTQ